MRRPDPTPDQIQLAVRRIQSTWTEADEFRHRSYNPTGQGTRYVLSAGGRVIRKPIVETKFDSLFI